MAEPVTPSELITDLAHYVFSRVVVETSTSHGHIIKGTSVERDNDGSLVLVLEIDEGMPNGPVTL